MYGKLYTNNYKNISNSIGLRIAVSDTLPNWLKVNELDEWLFPLAPEMKYILLYKEDKITLEKFIEVYKRKLLFKKEYLNKIINYLKDGNDVTLICYEKLGSYCHRYTLAKQLILLDRNIEMGGML